MAATTLLFLQVHLVRVRIRARVRVEVRVGRHDAALPAG